LNSLAFSPWNAREHSGTRGNALSAQQNGAYVFSLTCQRDNRAQNFSVDFWGTFMFKYNHAPEMGQKFNPIRTALEAVFLLPQQFSRPLRERAG
jgi:hypothetical protein